MTAWFLWVLLQDGTQGIVPVAFESLSECRVYEDTITESMVETKCFFGKVDYQGGDDDSHSM